MAKRLLTHWFLLALAMCITFATAYQKVELNSEEDLRTLTCGWPLAFVVSDQSWRDPLYPSRIMCNSAEWGDYYIILWPQFVADIVAFYVLGIGLLWGYRTMSNRPVTGTIEGS